MKMDYAQFSLNQIESMYRNGMIGEKEVTEYLRLWNAGPHFTQAILQDDRIKNDLPEKIKLWYPHLIEKYGVRI